MSKNKNIENELREAIDLLEILKIQNPLKFNRIFGRIEGLLESSEVCINENSL